MTLYDLQKKKDNYVFVKCQIMKSWLPSFVTHTVDFVVGVGENLTDPSVIKPEDKK